jgi:leucyl aminopeptidase (aminopeptidase T)
MNYDYNSLLNMVKAPQSDFETSVISIKDSSLNTHLPYYSFFNALKDCIILSWEFAHLVTDDPDFTSVSLSQLSDINKRYYASLDPINGYATSMANPDYATKQYGDEMGTLLSAIYTRSRSLRTSLLSNNYVQAMQIVRLYNSLKHEAEHSNLNYSDWLHIYKTETARDFDIVVAFSLANRFCDGADYYKQVVQNADLSDMRYLYRYGIHLSKHDFAIAEFLSEYPDEELNFLAKYIVKSWVDGFVRAKKDYRIKSYATVMIPVGMEILGRKVIKELEAIGLTALVPQPMSNGINRQFGYDHRFDNALVLDKDYVERSINAHSTCYENMKETITKQAGPVYVELFGETPFSPESKTSALKLSPEQQQLFREMNARSSQLYYKYYKRDEASFTIIAFPSPEIGEQFREIFADTVKINLLDSGKYAQIQQNIIDVLDTADYVHVKGKPGNDTDIKVKMHKLTDPTSQTLFENCVADVNIPVGEVFTSPVLEGTNGVLHVEDIYLGDLRFYNLKMSFKDGWVDSYTCTNFEDMEEGKKYIHENLFLPHQSLPLGEFAIGTNTTAYQIARKYDIMSLLPILIIEKMGPHFAIGDTCFSHEEDAPHPSFLNGKEMIAVDNEKSATRTCDPMNAYTQKHMDITLPYEMLESITAVSHDGSKTDIIRDGRFVVPGTEELNIPLMEMEQLI